MNNYLLIIGCSQRKIKAKGLLPAIDRYDGPTYRILRKMRRDGTVPERVDVGVISAKYGLISCQCEITDYNQRMTPERAAELTPKIHRQLEGFFAKSYDAAERGEVWTGYDEVFINLGKVYRQTLEDFHWGLTRTLEASGGIGLKNKQMKTWLERIYQEETQSD